MIRSRLRVYCGPENDNTTTVISGTPDQSQQVKVPAGEVFSALADAVQHSRAWLSDFEDDEITISSDLYEVILAYQHFRRPLGVNKSREIDVDDTSPPGVPGGEFFRCPYHAAHTRYCTPCPQPTRTAQIPSTNRTVAPMT